MIVIYVEMCSISGMENQLNSTHIQSRTTTDQSYKGDRGGKEAPKLYQGTHLYACLNISVRQMFRK